MIVVFKNRNITVNTAQCIYYKAYAKYKTDGPEVFILEFAFINDKFLQIEIPSREQAIAAKELIDKQLDIGRKTLIIE